MAKTWVDAGFKVKTVEHGATLGIDVEVVTKDPRVKGFSVLKRRWVVERTIGWLMQHRRLTRDYETRPANSEAMITIAMIDNLTRRLTDETTPTWHDPKPNNTTKYVNQTSSHACGICHCRSLTAAPAYARHVAGVSNNTANVRGDGTRRALVEDFVE